jgi:hypothetical protein
MVILFDELISESIESMIIDYQVSLNSNDIVMNNSIGSDSNPVCELFKLYAGIYLMSGNYLDTYGSNYVTIQSIHTYYLYFSNPVSHRNSFSEYVLQFTHLQA